VRTNDSERAAKGARNQALWRHVNERVEKLLDDAANPEFICECADLDCTVKLPMTIAEYEAVRASSVRFPIAPGHSFPEFERVVEDNGDYVVVEKFGEAGVLAEQLDPRSSTDAG
jgi:hypothetical protein